MNALKRLCNKFPLRVAAGPFRGTRCELTTTGDGVVAKLAGTYEMEIQSAFECVLGAKPDVIVDIGAAEGFYVAALARDLPGARVVAYEAKEEWHRRIRRMLDLNGVSGRCDIRGFCDRVEFRRLLETEDAARMFILMDIEGGEFSLLTPEVMPWLRNVELLVELHEPESRLQGDALVAMLGATHDVEVSWAKQERRPSDVPSFGWRLAAQWLPPVRQRLAEGRAYHMRWMHAVPKPAASAAEVVSVQS